MSNENPTLNSVELATELTMAWLSNPNTRADADEATSFLLRMKGEIEKIDAPADVASTDQSSAEKPVGAVSSRKSLASNDHILSMIDGKPYKSLKRHLGRHGLTPAEYRARYGLKPDYPMVAPGYSAQRREVAQRLGLGRKPKATATPTDAAGAQTEAPAAEPAKPPRGRKASADAAPVRPKQTGRRKAQPAEVPPSES